jgi:type IV pilus assembly protein PilC
MVRAGEVSGKLATVLSRFAEFIEHQAELRQKIKGALFYPTVLLGAGIAVTLYIVTFVIPQFAEIFLKAGVRLPLLTLVLYRIGIAIKHYWYVLVILLILAWIGFTFYAKTEKGGFLLDRLKLKLPIFGPLYRRAIISRFSRTLGTLLESGIPILEALDISQEVIENKVMARVIENAYHVVEKGQSLSEPLRASIDFPADAVQMIVAGEETGNVDVMLHKISDLYDMYLNYSLRRVTTILEPILLAIMGCVVGFIMASMLLPIFDMVKILRH